MQRRGHTADQCVIQDALSPGKKGNLPVLAVGGRGGEDFPTTFSGWGTKGLAAPTSTS